MVHCPEGWEGLVLYSIKSQQSQETCQNQLEIIPPPGREASDHCSSAALPDVAIEAGHSMTLLSSILFYVLIVSTTPLHSTVSSGHIAPISIGALWSIECTLSGVDEEKRHRTIVEAEELVASRADSQESKIRTLKTDTVKVKMAEVTVTGRSEIFQHAFNSHRVQIVSSADFQQSNSRDLADVLQRHSGAFIKSYGRGLASISLRGLSSSQSLLALDGIPLSSPQLGSFDLSLLPSIALESVELAYGGASSFIGSNGMSGMVNMTTKPTKGNSNFLFKTGMGQYGESHSGFTISQWLGVNTWLKLSAEREESEDSYPILDRNLLQAVRVDQFGWDYESRSGMLGIGTKLAGHEIDLNWWGSDSERGLGFATGEERGARQWDQSNRLWLSDKYRLGSGLFRGHLLYQNQLLRYARPFPFVNGEEEVIDDSGRTKLWQSELAWHSTLSEYLDMDLSFSFSEARATHPALARQTIQRDLGSSLGLSHANDIGTFNSSLRIDRNSRSNKSDLQVLPSIGYRSKSLHDFSLKVNLSRVHRRPSLNDLFWQPGGNLDLRAESGMSGDLGLTALKSLGSWMVLSELTYFQQRVDDQITWIDLGNLWSPQNIGKVDTRGGEWSVQASRKGGLLRGFDLFANLTSAKDKSDPESAAFGKQLRYTPKYQLKSNLRFVKGDFMASVNLTGVSKRFVTSDESQTLDPYVLFGGRVGYGFTFPKFEAQSFISVENFTDQDYQIISSYGMPPRVIRFELILKNKTKKTTDG